MVNVLLVMGREDAAIAGTAFKLLLVGITPALLGPRLERPDAAYIEKRDGMAVDDDDDVDAADIGR